MATVNLGAIKFNWKGAFNNSTAYAVDDVVSSGGSSYVCILASTGNAVSNGTYWNIMSSAGTNGTDVGTTLTTQGDILYRDGSGLQRLAKGTAGQVLQMNSGANAPEYATASSGGMMEFVTRTAITSNANNVTFSNLEANNYHKFIFQGIDSTANGGEDFCHQWSSNNGSSWVGSGYYSSLWQTYSNGGTNNTSITNGSFIRMADGFHTSGTDEGLHGEMTISNVSNGQRPFSWWHTAHKADSSGVLRNTTGAGALMNGDTYNAVKFFMDAGSITGSSYAFITHYKGIIS